MMIEIIENNFVAVAITSFLILFILTNNDFDRKTNRLFLAAASCVMILIIEEAWEAHLAVQEVYNPMRAALSAIGYTLRPMITYFIVIMFKKYTRPQFILISIPVIFNMLVSFSALFCGWSFWYTPDNEFVRGPLGFTPFFVAGFYVIILLVMTIRKYRHGRLVEAMIVSAIVLLAFFSTVLESMFKIQFIQNPSIATSITFYYMFLHSNYSNRDVLTGVLTRRRFYLDAEKRSSTLTAVISLDINNLKLLNDQYGHVEGDRALVAVSDAVKKYTGANMSLYRTGGDEFTILCHKMDEKKVGEIIGLIREDLKKTKYQCAIGYTLYSNQMNFDHACQLADAMMYENKRQMKSGMCEPHKE